MRGHTSSKRYQGYWESFPITRTENLDTGSVAAAGGGLYFDYVDIHTDNER